MRAWSLSAGLRALSVIYLMSASAFGVEIALHSNAPWAVGLRDGARTAAPYVKMAADVANERIVKPAAAWSLSVSRRVYDWINPETPAVARAVPRKIVAKAAPVRRPAIVVPEPPKQQTASVAPPKPAMEIAPPEVEMPLVPAPDANPPSPVEISRVLTHLKVSLTKELFENFGMFLYVSKADRGPWSQRMFVFEKQAGGDLNLLYSFPVSTGLEVLTPGPNGSLLRTNTTPGYYELDPDRMYWRYHSSQWDQSMPYAMFFNWEHGGVQTGLAIHAATSKDIAQLGARASAGCVRLHPQNARLLYKLIRSNYRGLAPRFAYDRRTATMANDGLLMHDKAGNLEFAEGYKVLVLIENNGGSDIVAALF